MNLNITARHFKLTEDLKQITRKEISRLEKYYDGIIEADVILEWEKMDRLAEVHLMVLGTILSAQERSDTMKRAIVRTVDKLERQLIKYKEKLHSFDHEKVIDRENVGNGVPLVKHEE